MGKMATGIASPTITEVLTEFLQDQEKRLSAKTVANYRSVIELLKHCLNRYAHQSLDEAEAKLFDQHYNAKGEAHGEFCDLFGPAHILPNVGEFLNSFMVRKVMAGQALLRAAGTVTKKLAHWLAEKGYVQGDDVDDAAERGGAAARDLPKAAELARLLSDIAEDGERGSEDDEVEGHFEIARILDGKIWIEEMDGTKVGPITLPANIIQRCRLGWTISGVAGRVGRKWALVEVWNVYPR